MAVSRALYFHSFATLRRSKMLRRSEQEHAIMYETIDTTSVYNAMLKVKGKMIERLVRCRMSLSLSPLLWLQPICVSLKPQLYFLLLPRSLIHRRRRLSSSPENRSE